METTENPPLTPEQQAQLDEWLAWQAANPYGDQDENGVDLSLLKCNIRLTPTQRYRRHQGMAVPLIQFRDPTRNTDFAEILRRFTADGVRFVLIGSLAMVLHGCAHLASDVDVVYDRDPANCAALAGVLAGMTARLRGNTSECSFVPNRSTLAVAPHLALQTDFAELDIFGSLSGADDFAGLWERSPRIELEDFVLPVASVDDLILMKRTANRLQDQNHLFELEALQKILTN